MKQGDLVMIDFPYADGTRSKWRPALVLSNERYNRNKSILLAGLYGKRQPHSVHITNKDMHRGELEKESYVSLQNVFSADKAFIAHTFVGSIASSKMKEVLTELQKCL